MAILHGIKNCDESHHLSRIKKHSFLKKIINHNINNQYEIFQLNITCITLIFIVLQIIFNRSCIFFTYHNLNKKGFFFLIIFQFDKKVNNLFKFDIHLQSFTVGILGIKY